MNKRPNWFGIDAESYVYDVAEFESSKEMFDAMIWALPIELSYQYDYFFERRDWYEREHKRIFGFKLDGYKLL